MKHARGFTLVESLVALALLSLGLLGGWGLLLSGLRDQADARRHAAATNLLRDMAERIRANPRAGAQYATSPVDLDEVTCEAPQACDVAERAAADLADFVRAARSVLPADSAARIEYEPAIGPAAADRYVITLSWRGTRDDFVVALQVLAPPVAGSA